MSIGLCRQSPRPVDRVVKVHVEAGADRKLQPIEVCELVPAVETKQQLVPDGSGDNALRQRGVEVVVTPPVDLMAIASGDGREARHSDVLEAVRVVSVPDAPPVESPGQPARDRLLQR